MRAIMAMTEGEDPKELSLRAQAATHMLKAARAKRELDAFEGPEDERLDAAGEQRLRDELLRRLDALAAEIAAGEADAEAAGERTAPD
ncbi:3-oxoacyl-ACP reductase-like protein [Brevundimonas lenta]|uniref:3-oxoacyl-ACP reductase-like protein n=1 Tax=Brevundimonas lenta TaxID=424796 RepID=A0A7W6JGX4_9CAUL|nr:hypothetical protein [Brevundimonas lenta]MBB4083896.1 3-oxoacyl-ACP reductase-like protein [Brevundimonas lenta]